MNWVEHIGVMVYIKNEIARVDRTNLWPYALPRVAADEARVASAEAHLGFALDPSYREFLLHADGWPAFFQNVDLFGTPELMGNERMKQGLDYLGELDPIAFDDAGITPAELLPIAVRPEDLFCLTTPRARRPGEIIWFGASEVERYPSFAEYFLAMEDYNRRERTMLASEH